MTWNLDMSTAPRDRKIVVAGAYPHVTVSKWLAVSEKLRRRGRWEMFCAGEVPIAWMEVTGIKYIVPTPDDVESWSRGRQTIMPTHPEERPS